MEFNLLCLNYKTKKEYFKFLILNVKRNMFTKVSNLKKSGDLITISNNSTINRVRNIHSASKLKSLDLAINNLKKEKNIEYLYSNNSFMPIKNISTGEIYSMQVNRYLAEYGKINKNYPVEYSVGNTVSFKFFKAERIKEANSALQKKQITPEQFHVFLKRMNALDLSYVHSHIEDIIEEHQDTYTVIYHIITTSKKDVDYGGPNKFKPIFLYHHDIKNKDFYTIALTYIHKIKRADYYNAFVFKQGEAFKNDSIDLQRKLAKNLKDIREKITFKMLNVNKQCLDLPFSQIDPAEKLQDSEYVEHITSYITHLDKI